MSTSKDLLKNLLIKQKKMKKESVSKEEIKKTPVVKEEIQIVELLETKTTSEDLRSFAQKIETEEFSIEPEIKDSIKELSNIHKKEKTLPKEVIDQQATMIDLSNIQPIKNSEIGDTSKTDNSVKILGNILKKKLIPKSKKENAPQLKNKTIKLEEPKSLLPTKNSNEIKVSNILKKNPKKEQIKGSLNELKKNNNVSIPTTSVKAKTESVNVEITEKYGKSDFKMHDLLDILINQKGSDLHLTVGNPPCIRIHGKIVKTKYPPLDTPTIQYLIYSIMDNKIKEEFSKELEVDFSYQYTSKARFRVNAFNQRRGLGAVLRIIPVDILTIEKLNLPRVIESFAYRTKGLILATGPTGSGKSTTLAALIDYINRNRQEHIITIEDPIEFIHDHKKCIVNQREVGVNTNSFARALKSALREDPDVILVGEMRDYETISLAITAAETGHLVFATLHTSSAVKTIDRIIDVFPAHQQPQIRMQLSETLIGIIAQTLVPRVDRKGRVCCTEILVLTNAVSNLIREAKTNMIYSVIQTHKEDGMRTLDDSLFEFFTKGIISFDQVYMRCMDKTRFEKLIPADKLLAFKKRYGFVDDKNENDLIKS